MPNSLLSYSEAAEEVQRYIRGFSQVHAASENVSATAEMLPLVLAADRVLAEEIRADRDQPPFPRSTRDGFACRAEEANGHTALRLAGHVRAGEEASGSLGPGEAWEIMTGAPVPEGANAVFMVEHAEPFADTVRLLEPRTVTPGENIVPAGAEAREGQRLVLPGVRLGAPQIAVAAQCGYATIAVRRKPVVAIISTGDELVPVEANPGPSQIRNSNTPMLCALVASAGAEAFTLPAVADNEAALDEAIATVLSRQPDLVLFTGGVSAGRFDLVEDALLLAGGRFFFTGVAMQPGKPVVFGEIPLPGGDAKNGREQRSGGPIPFFALPGNPISSAVTFHLFAAPVLAALGGDTAALPRFARARYAGEWLGKPGLTRFLPSACDFGIDPAVSVIPWHGSGDLAAFSRSNCLVVIPAEEADVTGGSLVSIVLT